MNCQPLWSITRACNTFIHCTVYRLTFCLIYSYHEVSTAVFVGSVFHSTRDAGLSIFYFICCEYN
uniref:Uncharacterized protein n=1 Tax=Anguilla anguilla TaxID=7936 RepID=A0A0E9XM81_ANGAN